MPILALNNYKTKLIPFNELENFLNSIKDNSLYTLIDIENYNGMAAVIYRQLNENVLEYPFPYTENISLISNEPVVFLEVYSYKADDKVYFHYTINSGLQGRGETIIELFNGNNEVLDTLIEPEGVASGSHLINKISDINLSEVLYAKITFLTYTTDNILKTNGIIKFLSSINISEL